MNTSPTTTVTNPPARRLPKLRNAFSLLAGIGAAALLLAAANKASAAVTGIWTNNNSTAWSASPSWLNATIPGSAGDTAYITNANLTANRTITADGQENLGSLTVGNGAPGGPTTAYAFTVATNAIAGNGIYFNNSGSGAQLVHLATGTNDTISAAMYLQDSLSITNYSTNYLKLSGPILTGANGGGPVTIAGGSGGVQIASATGTSTFTNGVHLVSGTLSIQGGNPVGAGGLVTGGSVGTGTLTIEDGTTITWATGGVGFGVNRTVINGNITFTNPSGRLTFGSPMILGGQTRTFTTLSSGTAASAIGLTGANNTGLRFALGAANCPSPAVDSGTLKLVGSGPWSGVAFNNPAYFTNNAGLEIGTNIITAFNGASYLGAAGTYASVTVDSGGYFNLSTTAATESQTVNSLSGTGGTVTTLSTAAGTAVLTINNASSAVSATYSGNIVDGASLNGVTGITAPGFIGVTKSGSGVQSLLGTNTYSGLTTVSAGALYTSTLSSNGNYTVSSGATLGVKVGAAGASLFVAGLTNAASTLVVDLNGYGLPTAPVITNAGGNTLAGNVTVNFVNKSGIPTGTTPHSIVVLTNAGANARSGAYSYVLGTLPVGVKGYLVDTTNAVVLNITNVTAVTDYLWTGATDNNWNTTSIDWQNDSSQSLAYSETPSPRGVIFDDSALSNTTINVTAPYSPTNVLFDNTAKTYTLYGAGKITGNTAVTLAGNGTVIVVNTNDYSGGTKVSGGTLQIGTNNTSGQVVGNLTLGGGKLVFARTDSYTQPGTVASSSYSSVLYNTATAAGSTNTVTLANGTNLWTSLYNNAGSAAQGGVMVVNASSLSTNYFSGTADVSSYKGNSGNYTFGVANTNAGSDFIVNGGNYFFTNNAFFATYAGGTLIQSTVFLNNANVYSTYFGTTNATDGGSHFIRGNLTMNGGSFVTKAWGLAFFVHYANSLVQTFNLNSGTVYVDDSNTPAGATNPVTFYGFTIGNQYGIYDTGLGASAVVNQHNGSVTMAASTNNNVDIGTTVSGNKVSAYLLDGGNLSVFGPNGGNVRLAGAGPTDSSGSFILTNNGVLQVSGNILGNASGGVGSQVFSFLGGTLSCSNIDMTSLANALGGATGTLTNQGGTLEPGLGATAAGKTTVTGNYVCTSAAKLQIDLLGTNAANSFTNPGAYFDNVNVTGSASLDGSLLVQLANGFTPTAGQTFTILTAGSLSGTFANLSGGKVALANDPAHGFRVTISGTSVVLDNYGNISGGSSTATLTNSFSGGTLTLSWPAGAGWILQSQTNSLASGLSTNSASWHDITGAPNPYSVTPNPANGTVFYRLRQ